MIDNEQTESDGCFFSVVIPAFNSEKYIGETLNSLAKQTFKHFDVCVVDDGSTDETFNVVSNWMNENSQIRSTLIHQDNQGIGSARNSAIFASSGKYIAFLDSDDIWVESKLMEVHEYLQGSADVDMLSHDIRVQSPNGEMRDYRLGQYSTYQGQLFMRNSFSTSATVVRRSNMVKLGGFSEADEINTVEDFDMWLRLTKSGSKVAFLHRPLSIYRYGVGVSSNIERFTHRTLILLDAHFKVWDKKNFFYHLLFKLHKARHLRGAGFSFMRIGNFTKARTYFLRGLALAPLSWKIWMLLVVNEINILLGCRFLTC